ncbi:MAG: DUF433 domain-containing protein [Desulfomonile sp.]|nr:DUF433 domain-containing protein [Desulfomonile sp.]
MTFDRITTNPAVMNGRPCVRNMRITVRPVVELTALSPNRVNGTRRESGHVPFTPAGKLRSTSV